MNLNTGCPCGVFLSMEWAHATLQHGQVLDAHTLAMHAEVLGRIADMHTAFLAAHAKCRTPELVEWTVVDVEGTFGYSPTLAEACRTGARLAREQPRFAPYEVKEDTRATGETRVIATYSAEAK